MPFDFKLPDLGEGIREAEILAVKVAEGDSIKEDQILFEVETDKAVVEIPSPVGGKVLKLFAKAGQIITVGTVMISVEESGQKQASGQKNVATNMDKESEKKIAADVEAGLVSVEKALERPASEKMTAEGAVVTSEVIASPATRQLAREMKIDLHKVVGSGAGGKISKEDVLAYAENLKGKNSVSTAVKTSNGSEVSSGAAILPDFTKFGKIERVPLRSLRRRTAQLMTLSWSKIPHVTHDDEADIGELEKFRLKYQESIKKQGIKITVTAFIMKAVALALQEFPEFNTSFDEQAEEIIFKRYYNIGMAVATERGLIVPVIKSVDTKNIIDLAKDIVETAEKARNAKIELAELQGSTFTVTNIGSIGGTAATPIIHYPEAAILAVMKTIEKPVVKNGKIDIGLIMPLCLSFDHRLADGAEAAKFTRAIISMLENPKSFEKYLGA